MGNGLRKQNGQQVGAQCATQAVQGPPGLPLPSPQPSSYLAVGSWLVDLRVPGGRWRRRREKRRERFHPFRVWEEQMKSAVSAPEGKVPRAPRTDLALPSAQCHVEQGRAPIVWRQGRGRRNPHPQRPRGWWPQ